ncbi:hypothetical protein KW842_02730 [Duganella sp. sic0402]|uniref:hypothetical protein n=1 Tax=Duganella sp. sic0402 TaxID=2854786 RepID=UPI001C4632BB|nr:hypothetical protein [Duganella sp. sic0402]MBV7534672.1 hypothetical protein [Duganella sp. sic0402]
MSSPFMRMWGAPILLAILTTVGLISALLGDGVWDYVSAVALGLPVLLCIWFGLRRKKQTVS